MIKIKIAEIFRHRNETTFRPYIMAKHLFREVGIEFVFEGNDYDLTWIGQASYSDKNHPHDRMLRRGDWFIKNKVSGDYVMFDGQDSATLMGTWDVRQNNNPLLFVKNTLYRDLNLYMEPSVHGRAYWGTDKEQNYQLDSLNGLDKIQLSGCNWLSTINPYFLDYTKETKDIDVFAMFGYPAKENKEFQVYTNQFYDWHRERCIAHLRQLYPKVKVAMLEEGKRVPIEEYYALMRRSKIVLAPFGYGEIAPRDMESAYFGCVLIKPNMDHINTIPNIYVKGETYVSCKWDYSDLAENISVVLSDFKRNQSTFTENMRSAYTTEYNQEKLVLHTYNWLNNLSKFTTE